MTRTTLHKIEEVAARFGFFKFTKFEGGTRKTAWHIKCSKCKREFSSAFSPNLPPEAMAKTMRMREWDVGKGERPLCPTCAHPRADKHPVTAKATLPDGARYMPPKNAIVAALEKAVEVAGVPALPQPMKDMANIAYAHIADRDSDLASKKDLLTRTLPPSRPAAFELELDSSLKPRPNFSLTLDVQRPPKEPRKLDVSKRRPRGPDKKPRKRRKPVDYKHEFEGRTFPHPRIPDEPHLTDKESTMNGPTPKPKITHAVFQQLDAVFDPELRLYKNGYTDQRVAADCGTSEDVVAYLRRETFGELAEDPRITTMREDLELIRMEMTDILKKMNGTFEAMKSRIEQIAMSTKSKL